MNTVQNFPTSEDWEKPPSVDDNDDRPRKKRRKYIAKACNECKRRKIKCNGQTPCQRCGRQRIECIYVENSHRDSPSEQENFERLFEQMRAMQDQITLLSASVRSIASNEHSPAGVSATGTYGLKPAQRALRRVSSSRETSFQGPTTSAFSFDLAKSSLQQRGIVEHTEAGDEGDMAQEHSPLASPSAHNRELEPRQAVDPLWTLPKKEALRLCRVYEEEMGIMYPVVELSDLLDHVDLLYGPMDRVLGPAFQPVVQSGLAREDIHILRIVFACALTAEASGRSEQAIALFDSVREVQDNCVWGPPDIKSIVFLTLVSVFYFQMDEETLAWRTVGIVERMCLEKGLHRRETLNQPAIIAAGKDRVLRLFWSVYILDIRWSFGTGMPFALEDTDIDPWLPEPAENTPYLRVMIQYSRIAAKVWKFISAFNNTNEIKKEEMNYLDWQVLRWVHDIPEPLRLDPSPVGGETAEGSRSLRRLRALLYLRGNQLRMLIHRPVLHTSTHIMRYPGESETVVEIAKDTIRFITRLNDTSDIYQLQQVAFNWFLASALAALFLAVAQAPTQVSASCKEEFYMALELVKGFSAQSYISRRLWKSIRSLRKLGPQLGLGIQKKRLDGQAAAEDDPDRHHVPDSLPIAQAPSSQSQTPQDGEQITQELMEWFESVGNLEDQIMGMGTGPVPNGTPYQQVPNGGFVYDYGEELSTVMKDFF